MKKEGPVKLIECPRDAMQGIEEFIPTELKTAYHQQLLECGFDTIDIGSFVSPKAIPQLKDTASVLAGLDRSNSDTELLVIVGNKRGAVDACAQEKVDYLGYPFSISETFLRRNINSSIEDSLSRIDDIAALCEKHNKKLVIYISMGFGNPYGEPWDVNIVMGWCYKLVKLFEVKTISLSDTIGTSRPESIRYLFSNLIPELPEVEFGAHLHTTPTTWEEKVSSAFESGCRRFDGAIKGFGGCPMAADRLTGNMPTERMVEYFSQHGIDCGVEKKPFDRAMQKALEVFPI
ncbi:MAG: hydroxymethylglutaryl-CoA lyase [Flavobacteriales bacterium]|nr:hydroxymethylglutaryl-CoA lyase [Flavobacteriales bacterium]